MALTNQTIIIRHFKAPCSTEIRHHWTKVEVEIIAHLKFMKNEINQRLTLKLTNRTFFNCDVLLNFKFN